MRTSVGIVVRFSDQIVGAFLHAPRGTEGDGAVEHAADLAIEPVELHRVCRGYRQYAE